MSEYILDLRKTVGHRPLLQVGASVIVVDSEGRILLQKRRDNGLWGYAGGSVELDEEVEKAAMRELFEETGLVASRWVELGTIHNAIGYSNERIVIYLAQDIKPAENGQKLDEGEFLTLQRLSFEQALEMTRTGEITDVKTLVGLAWARDYLDGRLPQAVVKR